MTEEERIELLREVARVAPKEMRAEFHAQHTISTMGFVTFREIGFYLDADSAIADARACFAMLDAMEARDLEGLGPEVVIELCGSGNEWYCRRWVCPESDSPHKAQEGIGSTRAEAIARAFVSCFREDSNK